MAIIQNTLYLTTPKTVVLKDHMTLRVEIERETRLTVPIHHLESICAFGHVVVTPPAMALCWNHQVAIHYHTENGHLLAQVLGSGDTRYLLRRAQYAAADNPQDAARIARQFVAGKLQNARSNLLRSGREADTDSDRTELAGAADELARLIHQLGNAPPVAPGSGLREVLDPVRGMEGLGTRTYYSAFQYMLKQQREHFRFITRTRRPPRDRINCLLSFIYALVRHDCLAALTTAGLDPYVGWLHATRGGAAGLCSGPDGRVPALSGGAAGIHPDQPPTDRVQALSRAGGRRRGVYRPGQERGHPGLAAAQAGGGKAPLVRAEYPYRAGVQHSSQVVGPETPR